MSTNFHDNTALVLFSQFKIANVPIAKPRLASYNLIVVLQFTSCVDVAGHQELSIAGSHKIIFDPSELSLCFRTNKCRIGGEVVLKGIH